MTVSDPSTVSALSTLGIPGLVIIILALVGVVIWQNKKIDKIYDSRLEDMKQIIDKYGDFSTQIALMIQKMDSVTNGNRRR